MAVSPTSSIARSDEEVADKGDEEEQFLTVKDRCKLFFDAHWRGFVTFLTPVLLIALLAPFPPAKYKWCAYVLIIMAVFWVTECIPLAITSFLPVIIFPHVGIMSTALCCYCYMNDTILMFLGSLMLAYAVEQSALHKRLSLWMIRTIGYSHKKLLFAVSYTTMFVSMWITNTAATTMMLPINFGILKVLEDQNLLNIYDTDKNGEKIASDITTCYFCAATFSATIGGIGTLVGTATNLVFKGLFTKAYPDAPEYLSFPKFSAFSILYMLLMQTAMYLNMLVMYFGYLRPNSEAAKKAFIPEEGIKAAKSEVDMHWKNLGKISFWEIMVIILFGTAIILFFCRAPQIFYGWGDAIVDHFNLQDTKYVKDSSAVMLICFLMMLLPANLAFFNHFSSKRDELIPDQPIRAVLGWKELNEILPYGFMFLLGGGFALSEAAKEEYSDLNGELGHTLKTLRDLPNTFVILIIIIFTVFITNFASNVAVANVVVPIVMQMAKEINKHPLWYNIAAGFSASYCFCLPVGTPGNLIVQGAAQIPTSKMMKAGAGVTVCVILLTWIAVCFWAPVIWPDLHKQWDY